MPQYPQNLLDVVGANGDINVRWMLACVSSGNCANVAEVYHGSGTRSQSVSGLAVCWPVCLLAARFVHGWSYDVLPKLTPACRKGRLETYATQKSCRTAVQRAPMLLRQVDYMAESTTAARAVQLSGHCVLVCQTRKSIGDACAAQPKLRLSLLSSSRLTYFNDRGWCCERKFELNPRLPCPAVVPCSRLVNPKMTVRLYFTPPHL